MTGPNTHRLYDRNVFSDMSYVRYVLNTAGTGGPTLSCFASRTKWCGKFIGHSVRTVCRLWGRVLLALSVSLACAEVFRRAFPRYFFTSLYSLNRLFYAVVPWVGHVTHVVIRSAILVPRRRHVSYMGRIKCVHCQSICLSVAHKRTV
jgi:hypothetical protein